MFAILEILPKLNGFRQRFLERYREAEISVERLYCGENKPYYVIRARERGDGIPWNEISKSAGVCRKRIIADKNLEIPSQAGLERYEPSEFPIILAFNTAVGLLKRSGSSPGQTTVSVADYGGEAVGLVEKLLPVCSSVRIITMCTSLYERLSVRLFEETGATLTVSDDINSAKGSLITVFTDRPEGKIPDCGVRICTCRAVECGCFSPGRVILPQGVYVPSFENISSFHIVSAMYELCGLRELADVLPATLFYDRGEAELSVVAEKMTKR